MRKSPLLVTIMLAAVSLAAQQAPAPSTPAPSSPAPAPTPSLPVGQAIPGGPTPPPSTVAPAPAASTSPAVPPQVILTPADPDSLLHLHLALSEGRNLQYQINELVEELNKQFQQEVQKESAPLQEAQAKQIRLIEAEVVKIRLANHWGDDVLYDMQKDQFVRQPKSSGSTSKPAAPPAPATKKK